MRSSSSGEKALILKKTMSEEQVEEIQNIVDIMVVHRRNIEKRKKMSDMSPDR